MTSFRTLGESKALKPARIRANSMQTMFQNSRRVEGVEAIQLRCNGALLDCFRTLGESKALKPSPATPRSAQSIGFRTLGESKALKLVTWKKLIAIRGGFRTLGESKALKPGPARRARWGAAVSELSASRRR